MTTPFIAEIRMFAGNFAPRSWAFCQGQIMSIAQNTALFSLVGTTYGGNGQTTFALPDLRGRVPVGTGQGPGLPSMNLGQMAGEATHTLIISEMPGHNHTATFTNNGSSLNVASAKATLQTAATNSVLAKSVDGGGATTPQIYAPSGTSTSIPLAGLNVAGTVATGIAGGSQPHNNMQPYLGMNYVIAIEGVYPSRN